MCGMSVIIPLTAVEEHNYTHVDHTYHQEQTDRYQSQCQDELFTSTRCM